ncbi:AAA family ATPase [Streptomyces sp. NPDC048411]|uniref:ATP-binding protein n=1 Tax=Streptomyces sp. NPDC048411 TaxID=3157206 RepID=UPI0034517B9C
MTGDHWRSGRVVDLIGRHDEREVLERVVNTVRAGESSVLVLRGDPGVGKTALLDHLAHRAADCRMLRVVGVQSEMELAFAGLHQLCAPLMDRLERPGALPAPQQDALRVALGLAAGPVPDQFLVALGVLGLLSDTAGERPVLSIVDDQQWLDRASAQTLGFVARRLDADPIAFVFGTRIASEELAVLPELHLTGLKAEHSRLLLESVLTGPLDPRVRDQIVTETQGNPLALLELLRGTTPAQLAGGFGLPRATTLPSQIEESFLRQLDALPTDTRRLLQLAAADPSGDPTLVWRAAQRLGIPLRAATPAADAGLAEFGARVWFRHPLLRSAAYRSTSLQDRQAVHLALVEATDPASDPDRRAWHAAQAASGPDEEVAADLARSAERAQARGGPAAAAAFLERSVLLTTDPVLRVERMLVAAQANVQAGAFAQALYLLTTAEGEQPNELQRARAELLRGHICFASGLGREAPPLLLKAAQRLERIDLGLARESYLNAWFAALFAGHMATTANLAAICRAARRLPPAGDPQGKVVPLLDALTSLVIDGPVAAAPLLRTATDAFAHGDVTQEEMLRWGSFAQAAAIAVWDWDAWHELVARQAAVVRNAGALDRLPVILIGLSAITAWAGDFAAADAMVTESDAIADATGNPAVPFGKLLLLCLRGDLDRAVPLIEATVTAATAGGQGLTAAFAHLVAATLYNGLGRYSEALEAAQRSSESTPGLYVSLWALPELIEAAVRNGNTDAAAPAMALLAESARAGGSDIGLGIEARCRALLSDGETADSLYREAVERLSRTPYRPDLGRAHLLYGEWLRREGRRTDARTHLRAAHDLLTGLGAHAFTERAERELRATGEHARKRTVASTDTLTPQEALIARLARDGRTNAEIGVQLFISARTVEWHLRKIFTRLGITSRRELATTLDQLDRTEPSE